MTFAASEAKVGGLAARVVLQDCRTCLARLEEEQDDDSFRITWVAMCALLRAVGHVLKAIDRPAVGEATRAEINSRWAAWNSADEAHAIFRDFIKSERDAVLKEYKFGYGEEVVELALVSIETGERKTVALPSGLYRPHAASPSRDEDSRDLVQQAIDWWDQQLGEIEKVGLSH